MIDRDAALRSADSLVRRGRLDAAIDEYVRLVKDQPQDWNTVNVLGDLYARTGDTENAIAQFTRLGDFLTAEGIFPKATAVYRKALKVKPDDQGTLLRLADVSTTQKLFADAKQYLQQLADVRRDAGDRHGLAECLVRLASFEDADVEAVLGAARAARAVNDQTAAMTLFCRGAEALRSAGRDGESSDVYLEAATLDCASHGDAPELLLAAAHHQLALGNEAEARRALTRLLAVAPDRGDAVVGIAHDLLDMGQTILAYGCLDVAIDAALLESRFERSAALLQDFVERTQYVPALRKLRDVCREAGFDERRRAAHAHLERLGENEEPPAPQTIDLDAADVLAGVDIRIEAAPVRPGAIRQGWTAPDLEDVFGQMRAHAQGSVDVREAQGEYERAQAHLQNGRTTEAIDCLKAVARTPLLRFAACVQLGRIYREAGDAAGAAEWLLRATEAPAGAPEDALAVMYDLACALEELREPARALAVLLEIRADAADYRDVPDRIARLLDAQPGSRAE